MPQRTPPSANHKLQAPKISPDTKPQDKCIDMHTRMHYHACMNVQEQLTIRGVDQTTKERLQARAQLQGMSLNAYNLELLRREAGTGQSRPTNGLERFAGTASLELEIEDALKDQRRATRDKWESYGL